MTTCSEGDLVTPEHAYLDILNTDVMGFTYQVKPVNRNSLVFPGYLNYHTTPLFLRGVAKSLRSLQTKCALDIRTDIQEKLSN